MFNLRFISWKLDRRLRHPNKRLCCYQTTILFISTRFFLSNPSHPSYVPLSRCILNTRFHEGEGQMQIRSFLFQKKLLRPLTQSFRCRLIRVKILWLFDGDTVFRIYVSIKFGLCNENVGPSNRDSLDPSRFGSTLFSRNAIAINATPVRGTSSFCIKLAKIASN